MKKQKINDKGFTLVELIVVLVILAILAAILVPALLGYIDRARGSQVLLNAKSVMTAAQAEASNAYGTAKADQTRKEAFDENANRISSIYTTAEVADDAVVYVLLGGSNADKATPDKHASWTVQKVFYAESEDGNYAWFDGSTWYQNEQKPDYSTWIQIEKSSGSATPSQTPTP